MYKKKRICHPPNIKEKGTLLSDGSGEFVSFCSYLALTAAVIVYAIPPPYKLSCRNTPQIRLLFSPESNFFLLGLSNKLIQEASTLIPGFSGQLIFILIGQCTTLRYVILKLVSYTTMLYNLRKLN